VIDLDDELETPSPRGRPPKVLRQPLAPTSELNMRSDSWWMTVKVGESMTQRAEAERQRMGTSKEWAQISSNQIFGMLTV
jgi:hypothetical protein